MTGETAVDCHNAHCHRCSCCSRLSGRLLDEIEGTYFLSPLLLWHVRKSCKTSASGCSGAICRRFQGRSHEKAFDALEGTASPYRDVRMVHFRIHFGSLSRNSSHELRAPVSSGLFFIAWLCAMVIASAFCSVPVWRAAGKYRLANTHRESMVKFCRD